MKAKESGRPPIEDSEDLVNAVLDDGVVRAAIDHVGEEPTPSRIAARKEEQKSEQAETSLRTEGQRATSWLWESTQKNLAMLMVGGFMLAHVSIVLAIAYLLITSWELLAKNPNAMTPLVVILTASLGAIASLASSVASSYFSRTNSHKVGGVSKDHEGR